MEKKYLQMKQFTRDYPPKYKQFTRLNIKKEKQFNQKMAGTSK